VSAIPLVQRQFSQDERDRLAAKGHALPDGSYPIVTTEDLKNAIQAFGRAKNKAAAKRHIIKRARALGATNLLPEDWMDGGSDDATEQENADDTAALMQQKVLTATLLLERVAKPVIIQDESLPTGVMRIKAPFYISNSVSRAPGFTKKIVWQEKVLPELIQEGKAKIAQGQQVITSYARHAHALAQDDLPIGRVVDLEQEGGTGYATVDVYPVKPRGEHVQTLVQAEALNAMSLRSLGYKLVAGKLDGEDVLLCEKLSLDGLDFAPDGPAQLTYGLQILSQEAVIETVPDGSPRPSPKEETKLSDQLPPITLEAVRADAPDVIEQIEAPLRQRITQLEGEMKKLVQADELRKRNITIQNYAAKTGNPDEFARILTELCDEQGITSEAGVNSVVAPLLMQELERRQQQPAAPEKSKHDQLLDLFGNAAGHGAGAVTQENGQPLTPAPEKVAAAMTQELAVRATVGGLYEPEDA